MEEYTVHTLSGRLNPIFDFTISDILKDYDLLKEKEESDV